MLYWSYYSKWVFSISWTYSSVSGSGSEPENYRLWWTRPSREPRSDNTNSRVQFRNSFFSLLPVKYWRQPGGGLVPSLLLIWETCIYRGASYYQSFILSYNHLFIHLYICSFIHLFIYLNMHSFIHLFTFIFQSLAVLTWRSKLKTNWLHLGEAGTYMCWP